MHFFLYNSWAEFLSLEAEEKREFVLCNVGKEENFKTV